MIKFLALEVSLYVALSQAEIGSLVLQFFTFYAVYEFGYYMNDTSDVKDIRKRLTTEKLNQFKNSIPLRLGLIIALTLISPRCALISIAVTILFFIFNKSKNYHVRGGLLTLLTVGKFYSITLPHEMFTFDFLLPVYIFTSQKVTQYLTIKLQYTVMSTLSLLFLIWGLSFAICVYQSSLVNLLFLFSHTIYSTLYMRSIFRAAP